LLGNSAHTLHPIAAQGFNLAIYEVAVLVDGITRKLEHEEPVTAEDLHQMLKQCRRQQAASMNVSHGLTQLFANESLPVRVMRTLGMTGLDVMTPAKRKFIGLMTGRSGSMPSLLM